MTSTNSPTIDKTRTSTIPMSEFKRLLEMNAKKKPFLNTKKKADGVVAATEHATLDEPAVDIDVDNGGDKKKGDRVSTQLLKDRHAREFVRARRFMTQQDNTAVADAQKKERRGAKRRRWEKEEEEDDSVEVQDPIASEDAKDAEDAEGDEKEDEANDDDEEEDATSTQLDQNTQLVDLLSKAKNLSAECYDAVKYIDDSKTKKMTDLAKRRHLEVLSVCQHVLLLVVGKYCFCVYVETARFRKHIDMYNFNI